MLPSTYSICYWAGAHCFRDGNNVVWDAAPLRRVMAVSAVGTSSTNPWVPLLILLFVASIGLFTIEHMGQEVAGVDDGWLGLETEVGTGVGSKRVYSVYMDSFILLMTLSRRCAALAALSFTAVNDTAMKKCRQ